MNFYFVFQNKSFHEERRGGFLWAPQRNKGGKTFFHWTNVEKIRKGDLIFSSYNGELVAISRALDDGYEHDKPVHLASIDLWEREGWIARVEYFDIPQPIRMKDHLDAVLALQPAKYAPYNIGGGVM